MDVHGHARKQALMMTPFVRTLEFGGSNGYWNGYHMTVQTEDSIDYLRVLFPEKYDYVFLYDHTSSHAKKRVGGLNVVNMNKGYGGENMCSTLIEQLEGYLGPYHNAANPRRSRLARCMTWSMAMYTLTMAIFISRWISENARGMTPWSHSLPTKLGTKKKERRNLYMR